MLPMIILYGATASGKTDCALALAEVFPIEIINGDMGQAYTPLTIGTAKPANWKNLPIKHHLFDTINEPRNMTVIEFRSNVLRVMDEVQARGNIPVIVGGSGFYLKSLFFPPLPAQKDANQETIKKEAWGKTPQERWSLLHSIDPARAAQVAINDEYRVNRALSIWFDLGRKPSECTPLYHPIRNDFHVFYLSRDRHDLYARINRRVEDMMQQGWVDEVTRLAKTEWREFIITKKIIGYNEILDYIQGQATAQSYKNVLDMIQRKTRNYAKRQETFWKGFKKELEQAAKDHGNQSRFTITELNATDNSYSEVVTIFNNYFSAFKKVQPYE